MVLAVRQGIRITNFQNKINMTNIYDKILLAEQWQDIYITINKMVARDQIEVNEYEKKENHSTKAVAIRREKNEIIKNFIELTKQVIEAQSEELQTLNSRAGLAKYFEEKYKKLEKYATYCSNNNRKIDIELLPFIQENDYRI